MSFKRNGLCVVIEHLFSNNHSRDAFTLHSMTKEGGDAFVFAQHNKKLKD